MLLSSAASVSAQDQVSRSSNGQTGTTGVVAPEQDAAPGASIKADQAKEQVPSNNDSGGDIIVTGSRLRTGFAAPTPVTVTSSEQLRDASPGLISDALNQLPAFKNSSRSATAGPSSLRGNGAALLNLRGLEPQRTLVLLDGRRVVSSSAGGSPDVNLFPQDLVSRVEVVTGGASAVYGSDAVAGVVNFILDKDFTGLRLRGQSGISTYGDGGSRQVSATGGLSFADGRGHVIATTEYFTQDEIKPINDRDWSQQGYAIIANPNGPPSRLIAPTRASNSALGGLIVGGPLAGIQFLSGGVSAPFRLGTAVTGTTMIGGDGPITQTGLAAGLERWSNFGRVSFDVSPELSVFTEGAYAKSTSAYDIVANSATGALAYTIFSDNAFLPADIKARMQAAGVTSFRLARTNSDAPFIRADSTSKTYRAAGGFTYNVTPDLSFDGYFSHGTNKYTVLTSNDPVYRRRYASADAVFNPATNQIVCRSTLLGFDPGCVPTNLFGPGSPSQESIDYVLQTAHQFLTLKQDVASLIARGSPFSTGAGKVSIAAGFEYRKEKASQTSDEIASTAISADGLRGIPAGVVGQVGGYQLSSNQPFTGSYDVKEGFLEVDAPLLADVGFFHLLSLNGAIRYIDYSTVGGLTTWKVGAVWEPFADLRFRGTRSRDIRAANVSELFTPPVGTQGTVLYNGTSTFYLGKRSGNPLLEPEKADTTTLGVVYRPSWFPGFNASVDYFDINLKGAIAQLTAQQTVDQCAAGNAAVCSQLSFKGTQLIIDGPSLNLSQIKTRGVDVELSYSRAIGAGRLSVRALGSYLDKFETQTPGSPPIDRAGDISVGGTPHFTATFSALYSADIGQVFLQERLIGAGNVDNTFTPAIIADNHVPAVWYTDLTLRANAVQGNDKLQLFLTVNNLFNKEPPIVPSIPYGAYRATNFSLYDVVGRYMTFGVSAKF
jgi:outer membrane receptor protein involved in Fe transport